MKGLILFAPVSSDTFSNHYENTKREAEMEDDKRFWNKTCLQECLQNW